MKNGVLIKLSLAVSVIMPMSAVITVICIPVVVVSGPSNYATTKT